MSDHHCQIHIREIPAVSKTGGLYIDSSAIFESFAEEVVKYTQKSEK